MDPSKRLRLILTIGLFVIAVPLLGRFYPRGPGPYRDGQCYGRLETLSWAISAYSLRHHGQMPPMESPAAFTAALVPITGHPEDFVCPVTGAAYRPNPSFSRKPLKGIDASSAELLVEDARPHPGQFKRAVCADFVVRQFDTP